MEHLPGKIALHGPVPLSEIVISSIKDFLLSVSG